MTHTVHLRLARAPGETIHRFAWCVVEIATDQTVSVGRDEGDAWRECQKMNGDINALQG